MELKNDLCITGALHSVDQYLNIKLTNTRVHNEQKYPHMVRLRAPEAREGGGPWCMTHFPHEASLHMVVDGHAALHLGTCNRAHLTAWKRWRCSMVATARRCPSATASSADRWCDMYM